VHAAYNNNNNNNNNNHRLYRLAKKREREGKDSRRVKEQRKAKNGGPRWKILHPGETGDTSKTPRVV